MSDGGMGQAECLYFIITVPYNPAGGHTTQSYTLAHTDNLNHTFNSLTFSFPTVTFLFITHTGLLPVLD